MANAIPNDAGVSFRSDIEVSIYWGGKLSPEQLKGLRDGTYDWTKQFEAEVSKKLGIEYEMGTFAEADKDEESDPGDDEESA